MKIIVLSLVALLVVQSTTRRPTIWEKVKSRWLNSNQTSQKTTSSVFVPLYSREQIRATNVKLPGTMTKEDASASGSCNEQGCIVDVSKEFEMEFHTGAVATFELDSGNDELGTKTMYVTTNYVSYKYILEHEWVQPKHKVYALLANDDAGGDDWDACTANQISPNAMTNVGVKPQAHKIADLKYNSARTSIKGISDTFKCGHWTIDSLELCQMRHVEPDASSFINTFSVSPDIYLSTTICVYFDGEIADGRCLTINNTAGAFPLDFQLGDGSVTVTIKGIHDIPTAPVGQTIGVHASPGRFTISDDEEIPVTWYWFDRLPGFGSVSGSGLGSVQSRYISYNSNYSRLYTSDSLPGMAIDWSLRECDDTRSKPVSAHQILFPTISFAAVIAVMKRALGGKKRMVKVQPGVYLKAKPDPRLICVVIAVVAVAVIIAGATTAAIALAAEQNRCCMNVGGSTENYVDSLVRDGIPLHEKFNIYGPLLTEKLRYVNGMPDTPALVLEGIIGATLSATIVAKGVQISWSSPSGTIASWDYKYAKIYSSGSNSYIEVEFNVDGPAADVVFKTGDGFFMALASDTLTNGLQTKTYAVSVNDITQLDLQLCIAWNEDSSDCKTPDDYDIDDGETGGDQNSDQGDAGTHASFSGFLGLNVGFAIFFIVLWIVLVVLIIIFGYKFAKYLIYLLLFCSFSKAAEAEFVCAAPYSYNNVLYYPYYLQQIPDHLTATIFVASYVSACSTDSQPGEYTLCCFGSGTVPAKDLYYPVVVPTSNLSFQISLEDNLKPPFAMAPHALIVREAGKEACLTIKGTFCFEGDMEIKRDLYQQDFPTGIFKRFSSNGAPIALTKEYDYGQINYGDLNIDDFKLMVECYWKACTMQKLKPLLTKLLKEDDKIMVSKYAYSDVPYLAFFFQGNVLVIENYDDTPVPETIQITYTQQIPFGKRTFYVEASLDGNFTIEDYKDVIASELGCDDFVLALPPQFPAFYSSNTLTASIVSMRPKCFGDATENFPDTLQVNTMTDPTSDSFLPVYLGTCPSAHRAKLQCRRALNLVYCYNDYQHAIIDQTRSPQPLFTADTYITMSVETKYLCLDVSVCTGQPYSDDKGSIVCDAACCLLSRDSGITHTILKPGASYTGKHLSKYTLQHVSKDRVNIPMTASLSQCKTTFSGMWDCLNDHFPSTFDSFIVCVVFAVVFLTCYIAVKIATAMSSRFRRSRTLGSGRAKTIVKTNYAKLKTVKAKHW